jgi:hypothetical protein
MMARSTGLSFRLRNRLGGSLIGGSTIFGGCSAHSCRLSLVSLHSCAEAEKLYLCGSLLCCLRRRTRRGVRLLPRRHMLGKQRGGEVDGRWSDSHGVKKERFCECASQSEGNSERLSSRPDLEVGATFSAMLRMTQRGYGGEVRGPVPVEGLSSAGHGTHALASTSHCATDSWVVRLLARGRNVATQKKHDFHVSCCVSHPWADPVTPETCTQATECWL